MIDLPISMCAHLSGRRSARAEKARQAAGEARTVTQAFRHALDPTVRRQRLLARAAGTARHAFNWGLASACWTPAGQCRTRHRSGAGTRKSGRQLLRRRARNGSGHGGSGVKGMEPTEDAGPVLPAITPYWLERRWNAVKGRFENLRRREPLGAEASLMLCMEQQTAWMVHHHPDLRDSGIIQAYMIAALRLAREGDPALGDRYEGFSPEVWELQRRVLATCHPDFHPELAAMAAQVWRTPADRQGHFERCAACLRWMIALACWWTKRGPRQYAAFITQFVRRGTWSPDEDVIHWALLPQSNGS